MYYNVLIWVGSPYQCKLLSISQFVGNSNVVVFGGLLESLNWLVFAPKFGGKWWGPPLQRGEGSEGVVKRSKGNFRLGFWVPTTAK